ncbi:WD-REPEATS-REGION domain-containing protein [Mycena sanguinolenta]|uniref:WD-REPEATS-REGION domain-containing protein n=1 Tax=Mycena sanguinolenta TaxID=230812 RepID=A0A8H6XYY7_9AGAR|nr:WD-REPEATS-REGION domain-containing protein [Mycena sanguinolenta]
MQTPGGESVAMRLGPNQSLTLNTTVHGGRGGPGGASHGQAPGGQGGLGEGTTVNYNFSLEQTKDLTSKLNYGKDAGARPSKACLQGTRVKLLAKIRDWALHPAECTLLLYGAAGTGKSAVVHTIARDLDSENLALVPFFAFNRSVQNRSSSQLIPTWAKKLAELHPPYQAYLHGLQLSDLESTDPVHQRDILFLNGIASFTNCEKPLVFIIDALDECPRDEAYHLFRMLQGLVCEPTLPVFARFLFTYRSHGEILETFENAPSILHINIDDEKETIEDIYKFVTNELDKPKVQNMAGDVAKAAQKVFECAAVLCRQLTTPMMNSARQKFIKTLQGGQITSLYGSYRAILEIHLGDDYAVIQVFQQVMTWVFTVRTPQTRQVLREIATALLPEENQSDPDDVLTWLGSLLSGTTSDNEPISPLHTSLRDFLIDKKQSGEFWIKLGTDSHQELALACLKIMNTQLRFNICGLETSFKLNSHVKDLSHRVERCISPGLHYACLTVGHHLQNTLPVVNEFDSISSVHPEIINGVTHFLENNFLFWLEVHSCMATGRDGPGTILPQFLVWAMGMGEDRVQEVLLDYIQFEKRFRQGYIMSAPQVYISGLLFAPRDSIICQQYRFQFQHLIQASGALDTVWPPSEALVIHEENCVWSISFSPDGLHIASSGKNIQIWNAKTGQQAGKALVGHTYDIQSIAFSPDGIHVASASNDYTVRLWDVKTGQQVGKALIGHTMSAVSIAFSPDGNQIASGSIDETVCLWDVKTGQQVGKLIGHTSSVWSVAFSPDGNYITSASGDKTIRLWDVKTWQQVGKALVGHTSVVQSVAFSPDGSHIASASNDYTVRLWDVKARQQIGKALIGHTMNATSVAFSPDGSQIASGSHDRTVCLWDVKTQQQVGKFIGHTSPVWSVAFSPDGDHIASASGDKTICVWDVKAGQQVGNTPIGHTDSVQSVAFSPDGSHIASASNDKTIRLWDINTSHQHGEALVGHTGSIWSVAFTPDGSHIASGSHDRTVRLWDVMTGQEVGKFIGHTSSVCCIAFSPDGSHIASGSTDKIIFRWDAKTQQQVGKALISPTMYAVSVAFSPDQSRIASGSHDGTIHLWDMMTGQQVGKFIGHTRSVWSIAFSPDGGHIASGSGDRTICLWDVRTGQQVGNTLIGHTDSVQSVSFSPDGSHIASGSTDKTICLWDVQTGQQSGEALVGHTGEVWSVAFSPDGSHIASGSTDTTVRSWDVNTGQQVGKSPVGRTEYACSAAFSSDRSYNASGSTDQAVRLWEAKTGQQVGEQLPGHIHHVRSLAFSPVGHHIVSGGDDKIVQLRDIRSRQKVGEALIGNTDWVQSSHVKTGHPEKPPTKHNDIMPSLVFSVSDGWFRTSVPKCYALWIPHPLRQHLFNCYPWPVIFCTQPQIRLDFTNAALGPSWAMIHN